MTRRPTALPRVVTGTAADDVTVAATFRLTDPVGLTEVSVEPDPSSTGRVLQLIDAAIARLAAYRDAYSAAEAQDMVPVPLPVPWHGWGV